MEEPELKACPCGKTPKLLGIQEGSTVKWAWAYGNCCSDWNVEFRTGYKPTDSDECMEYAIEAWNSAQRKAGKP